MKKFATLVVVAFSLSLMACGGSETKDDEQVTEKPTRTIEAATSGGAERGFDDEEPAADGTDEAPGEEAAAPEE